MHHHKYFFFLSGACIHAGPGDSVRGSANASSGNGSCSSTMLKKWKLALLHRYDYSLIRA